MPPPPSKFLEFPSEFLEMSHRLAAGRKHLTSVGRVCPTLLPQLLASHILFFLWGAI